MGWWFFFMWIASTIVSALMAPKPKNAKAGSLGTNSFPTAEEGRSIPYLLGTCKVEGPNVIWWGDVRTRPIKKRTGGFLGIGSKSVIVGYRYDVGMQLALCTGEVDALEDIYVGDKSLKAQGVSFPVPYNAAGATKTISLPGLFGGDEQEGGIEGTLAIYFGSRTQTGDSYLSSVWGTTAPGFRGLAHLVLRRFYIGTQPYPKTWAPVLRRCPCPGGLNAAKANIDGDANPAYGIADILTHHAEMGGMGLPEARLDWSSFQAAGNTLFNEGFGISMLIDAEDGADAHLSEICRAIDGVLYTDPVTGLWTMKLIRADYDPATLPSYAKGPILSFECSRPSWPETVNKVVIRYLDRSKSFSVRTAQDGDSANRAIRGVEESTVLDFMIIAKAATAQRVAAREKRTLSYPLMSGTLTLNREGWKLRPGSPLKVTWAPLGIVDMVFRVRSIRYGALEARQIVVDVVEDVWSATAATFTPPSGSGWTDPVSAPVAVAQQKLVEVPYWLVGETRNVLALGVRGDSTTTGAEIWTNEGSGYLQTGSMEAMTPSGTLTEAWSAKTSALDSTGFIVSGTDLDALLAQNTNADGRARGENLALIDDEWISWTTCTDLGDGTYRISGNLRGILDTVPADHAIGTRVWFLSEGCGFTQPATDQNPGPTGEQGPQGETGGTGPQGPKGDKGDPGLSTFERTTLSHTTITLAASATEEFTLAINKTADLLKVATDFPAWVRVYGSAAMRSDDSGRLITEDPAPGAGCFFDGRTESTALEIDCSPVPIFVNHDSTPANTAYLSLRNLDTVSRAITLDLTFIPQEQ